MRIAADSTSLPPDGTPVTPLVDAGVPVGDTHDATCGTPVAPHAETAQDEGLVFRGKGAGAREQLADFQRQLRPESLERLAERLSVSKESLRALDVGFARHAYAFPMRDADKQVIGFALRTFKGDSKIVLQGSRNGLFVPRYVTPGNVQLIVEGVSDTAAAWAREFAAIGRSGAHEAIDLAVAFVRKASNACPCVVGDNDPDGTGLAGAERVVDALLAAGVPCRLLMLPMEFKDLREWLTRERVDGVTLAAEIQTSPVRYPHGWPPTFTAFADGFARSGGLARLCKKQPRALAVLWAIASHADKHAVAIVTRERIGELANVSAKTVDRCIKALAEEGLLLWIRGHTEKANTYVLKLGPYKGATKLRRRVRPALRYVQKEPTPQQSVQKAVEQLAKHLDPSYRDAVERNREGREREPRTRNEILAKFLGVGRARDGRGGSRSR